MEKALLIYTRVAYAFPYLDETLIIYSMFIINIFVSTNNTKLSPTANFLESVSVYKSVKNFYNRNLKYACMPLCAPNKMVSSKSYKKLKLNIKLTYIISKFVQKEVLACQWL